MWEKIKQSSFLRQNAIFFVGALLVSVLNYLYYPILGRMLSLADYGEVQVLVSLFLQLTIFMLVLGQVTVNVVANTEDTGQRHKIISELKKLGFLLCIVIFAGGVAASGVISEVLQFHSSLPFILLLMALVATVPITFQTSLLKGERKFGSVSIANAIGAGGKLLCSVIFVLMGWGAAGAIGGIIAAQLLAWTYAAGVLRKSGLQESQRSSLSLPDFKLIRKEIKFAGFVLITSLGVTVLSSIDTVIVKMFFDPDTAGMYAGISIVAKIIFFLTASVAQVMMPSVKLRAPTRENRRLFVKSFILLGVLGGGVSLFFVLFPDFIIGILMGRAFLPVADLLPVLGMAMLVVSVINLIVSYYIALKKYETGWIVVAGVGVTSGMLILNHDTLGSVALNLLWGAILMLSMFTIWRLKAYMTAERTS